IHCFRKASHIANCVFGMNAHSCGGIVTPPEALAGTDSRKYVGSTSARLSAIASSKRKHGCASAIEPHAALPAAVAAFIRGYVPSAAAWITHASLLLSQRRPVRRTVNAASSVHESAAPPPGLVTVRQMRTDPAERSVPTTRPRRRKRRWPPLGRSWAI